MEQARRFVALCANRLSNCHCRWPPNRNSGQVILHRISIFIFVIVTVFIVIFIVIGHRPSPVRRHLMSRHRRGAQCTWCGMAVGGANREIIACILSFLCPHRSESLLDYLSDVFEGKEVVYDLGFMIGAPVNVREDDDTEDEEDEDKDRRQ